MDNSSCRGSKAVWLKSDAVNARQAPSGCAVCIVTGLLPARADSS